MKRLRVLVLAPGCNPEGVSIPYVTFCHAEAHSKLHEVTLVVGIGSEAPVRRTDCPFHGIEVVRQPWLDRIFAWTLRNVFKFNFNAQMLTPFSYPFSLAFEWGAWRMLRRRIVAGEFDVVLRVSPMANVLPSAFAFFLRKGPIPLVIGPLQGGLPWPSGFPQIERDKEWVSRLRKLHRYLPFARSTRRHSAAIIAASSQTFSEYGDYREKVFFVPEPGISPSQCIDEPEGVKKEEKLELLFVAGMIPRKGCDLALRAAAPLLRDHLAHFTLIGDGPERRRLEQLASSQEIESEVTFCGWLDHAEVMQHMRAADIFVFPSLRDNGAGVVFEALASGAVPLVVDFGGPGDIVHSEVGYKVPLTSESEIVMQMEKILTELAGNRELLKKLRKQGVAYARSRLTWDAKAQDTTKVLNWVLKQGPKPDLRPPKVLDIGRDVPCLARAARN